MFTRGFEMDPIGIHAQPKTYDSGSCQFDRILPQHLYGSMLLWATRFRCLTGLKHDVPEPLADSRVMFNGTVFHTAGCKRLKLGFLELFGVQANGRCSP